MNCREAERLIYLFKPGERTLKEESLLMEHLLDCTSCRELNEEVKGSMSQIFHLSIENGDKARDDYYKDKLFRAVNELKTATDRDSGNKFYLGFRFFSQPAFRYLAAAVISAIVLTFLFQNYSAYNKLSKLEAKFWTPSTFINSSDDATFNLLLADLKAFQPISKKKVKNSYFSTSLDNYRGNEVLLMLIRNHKHIKDLSEHNPGIRFIELIRIYNNSTNSVESKRKLNKSEDKI